MGDGQFSFIPRTTYIFAARYAVDREKMGAG